MSEKHPPKAKPTIGRSVHYRSGSAVQAATITGLTESDDVVDLTVFTNSPAHPVAVLRSQMLVDPAVEGVSGWYWPPRV